LRGAAFFAALRRRFGAAFFAVFRRRAVLRRFGAAFFAVLRRRRGAAFFAADLRRRVAIYVWQFLLRSKNWINFQNACRPYFLFASYFAKTKNIFVCIHYRTQHAQNNIRACVFVDNFSKL